MNSWIFQGNPDTFDVEGYLSHVPVVRWSVRQRHLAARMRPGDRVFFWRAGAGAKDKAGVVAAGWIESDVQEMPADAESQVYVVGGPSDSIELRVVVRVERVADARGRIKRDWLKDDPVLHDLRILRLRSETNFWLSEVHAERLERLWSNTGRDWMETESLAGLWAYVKTRSTEVSQLPGRPVADVALLVGRAVTAVYNKVMNFRAIDPTDGRAGLSGGSEVDRIVWSRYFNVERQEVAADSIAADYERTWLTEEPLPSFAAITGRGARAGRNQGFEPNPLVRKRIEDHAVEAAERHYRSAGYNVENVGNTEPFDLRCMRSGSEVRVEVKGTRGLAGVILLTEGEVANARNARGYRVDLFVLSEIRVAVSGGEVSASEGSVRTIENWVPESEHLVPIAYRYRLI